VPLGLSLEIVEMGLSRPNAAGERRGILSVVVNESEAAARYLLRVRSTDLLAIAFTRYAELLLKLCH